MTLAQLLRRQWEGYSRYHRSPTNLLLHIVAVPLFLLANVCLVAGVLNRSVALAGCSVLGVIVSLALQRRGHQNEENPTEPFNSASNATVRILTEQWITFPRFVLSGNWRRALRDSSNVETA